MSSWGKMKGMAITEPQRQVQRILNLQPVLFPSLPVQLLPELLMTLGYTAWWTLDICPLDIHSSFFPKNRITVSLRHGNVPSTITLYIPLQQGCPCDLIWLNARRAGSFGNAFPYLPAPACSTPFLTQWQKPGGGNRTAEMQGTMKEGHPFRPSCSSRNSAKILSGISVSTCPKGNSGSFHFCAFEISYFAKWHHHSCS